MNTQTITWSQQQTAFLAWAETGKGSAVLEAVAGAGKTTTLIEAARLMRGQVAIMAYNKRISEEIKAKLVKAGLDWKKAQGGTAHSFAFAAYRKERPGVRVEERKVRDLVEAALPSPDGGLTAHPLKFHEAAVTQLVSLAKQMALGVVGPIDDLRAWRDMAEHFDVFDEDDGPVPDSRKDEVLRLAMKVLRRSNDMLDLIDFDDMIYMTLYHRCRIWQFDVVMVDEAQDTNAARRALVRAMVKKGGRVVAVGDPHQAIYGFTGADSDALDLIAQDHSCRRLPLSVSYRCPQAVVRFAQQWVSHIEAAPSAPEGEVLTMAAEDFMARNDLDARSAVLSRTTKPLVSLAFKLIRVRVPCRIEGRDIAAKIKKLMERWKVTSLDTLEDRLGKYLERETTKLLAAKRETALAEVEDSVETIRVIIDQCRREGRRSVSEAVSYVDEMFSDGVSDVLVLSTIHKAKGREWPRVYWLDRAGTCPNKWARQEWQVAQEVNLMYVAATRAQEVLIDLLPPAKEARTK